MGRSDSPRVVRVEFGAAAYLVVESGGDETYVWVAVCGPIDGIT